MKKLYIISGHGAGDCGAVGNGFQEAERVRALATKIKEYGGDGVILADFNINSYKSNIIGKGLVPKDCLILELHIDCSKNTEAKGGHVIINANFKPDKYDEALAKMISTMFPGRAKTIVGRIDLANVRRAAECGYNYRLLECCFISNADDIKRFNTNMDELAKNILNCFDISVKQDLTVTTKPTTSTAANPKKDNTVLEWQKAAMADGFKFAKFGADGKWGSECEGVAKQAICKKRLIYKYKNLTKIIQKAVGVAADGLFGNGTKNAVIAYQRKHGLVADGCVGLNTWKKILGVK